MENALAFAVFSLIVAAFAVLREWKPKSRVEEVEYIPPVAPNLPPPEPIIPIPVPEPVQPVPEPVVPSESKREKLYRIAKECRGVDTSPADVASDDLACAESLNGVFKKAFGSPIATGTALVSTNALYKAMIKDPRLELVPGKDALPGDIVISPTGYSTKGADHGHCGIRGITTYMSNDSTTGKWTANYNLPNWKLVFHDTLGFPIHHFRVKE